MRWCVLVLLVSFVLGSQYVSIPKTPYGLTVGDPEGRLHIQAFYDLLCIDSKTSDYILRSVFQAVSMTKSSVKFTYNLFPLPYHFYAFKVTQAYEQILSKGNPVNSEKFIRYIFDNQASFDEQKWLQKTPNEFTKELSKNVSATFSVSELEMNLALKHGSTSDISSRGEWKYATSLGVSGTPIFYANGIRIDGAENWKYAEWIAFLTKYTTREETL